LVKKQFHAREIRLPCLFLQQFRQRGVVSEIADETLYGFFLVLTPANSTPLFSAMATDDSGPVSDESQPILIDSLAHGPRRA
jgi:hypothetical protein